MKLPDSIIVIVPHPDDEALLAAGLIRQAVSQGKRICVALVTNGDYLCADYTKGRTRLCESLTALEALGVPRECIYFFGYPDTGFEPEVSFLTALWNSENPDMVFPSSCSCETYGVPGIKDDFAFARTGAHAPYTRSGFQRDLKALFDETKPELVITTSEWDQHGDHAALSHFVRWTLTQYHRDVTLWEGIIHSPAGDLAWPIPGMPQAPFTMPPGLETATTLKWDDRISVPMPEDCPKQDIIRIYRTALSPDEPEVVAYLLAFAKREEIFWKMNDTG